MRKHKPSLTARKIALAIVTLSIKPGMEGVLPVGVAEATAKLLVAAGVVSKRVIRMARSKTSLSIYQAFDRMLPGQFEALAQRKAFFEHHVRNAIAEGATQVLILGAGYDTLAWRLSEEYPAVNFFEIDHPATARVKAQGITVMGKRDNLSLIAEDLSKRKLVQVLSQSHSWDRLAKTIIVAEGLVMYLPPEAVRDLFLQCTEITGAESQMGFSYLPADKTGRLDVGRWTGLMLFLQKTTGEPWLWGIHPERLQLFLSELGWSVDSAKAGTVIKRGAEFFVLASTSVND